MINDLTSFDKLLQPGKIICHFAPSSQPRKLHVQMESHLAYLLAIASSLCFASASVIFADISRLLSPLWMNVFKALAAWIFFALSCLAFGLWTALPSSVIVALFCSGILGLAIGDIFLLTAYARMGAARTLILFGFQPFFIGVAAHFLFGQEMTWLKALAVLFFLSCLFTFSLEKYRQEGHWELYGLAAALIGVLFDNSGLLISRWAFDQVPELTAFQANVWRCSGALVFFAFFGRVQKVNLWTGWQSLSRRLRIYAVLSAFLGTFMSLVLYLTAVKIGHLASISAVGGAGPIICSCFECIYQRKRPTRYLLVALIFFLIGFTLLSLD